MRFAASAMSVDDATPLRHVQNMTMTKLDLTGLKCPLPALKTRKALKALMPGDCLEVQCREANRIVFVIEKANGMIGKSND